MYQLIDLNKIIGGVSYHAHTCEGKPEESLIDHSDLVLKYYDLLCRLKGIDRVVRKAISECGCFSAEEQEIIYNLFVNAIYLHDSGKINPNYQVKLGNKEHKKASSGLGSTHSILSAYIYIDQLYSACLKRPKLAFVLFKFGYIISKHHGWLSSHNEFYDKLEEVTYEAEIYQSKGNSWLNLLENFQMGYNDVKDSLSKDIPVKEIPFYILEKLLYAVLTACDFCATYEYKNGKEMDISVIDNIDSLVEIYEKGELYQGICEYKKNPEYFNEKPINALRSDLFIEAEKNIRENSGNNICYLEAPTGSGKTNMSINLALQLMKNNLSLNNLFYIFPFNTLVEQTANSINEFFPDETCVVNSLTPIKVKDDEDPDDYEASLMNRQMFNYPIVITSHVNFFRALFGTNRENSFPLAKFANSVIIIDEIQSYRNRIWRQMINMLDAYAEILNMKIIIMSATLPKLDVLMDKGYLGYCDLVKDPSIYYNNPLFRDRVKIDLSLLQEGKIDLEFLVKKVMEYKGKKVLVEFIKKSTAREFYNRLVEIQGNSEDIVELTGDDNKCFRKQVISEIKTKKSIIVIATQVIEAGVDIDMDVGFKDISIPDSEEQFLGRINRSCSKPWAIAYFFDFDDAKEIYREDVRVNYSILKGEIADMLIKKEFNKIYQLVLADVYGKGEKFTQDYYYKLPEACLMGNYQEIEKRLRLIDSNNIQIFIAYTDKFGNEILDGKAIWDAYKSLCRDPEMQYAEKQVLLSRLYEKMSYFTYNTFCEKGKLQGDDELGGIVYFDNGDRFMVNGKFAREEFNKHSKEMIL